MYNATKTNYLYYVKWKERNKSICTTTIKSLKIIKGLKNDKAATFNFAPCSGIIHTQCNAQKRI